MLRAILAGLLLSSVANPAHWTAPHEIRTRQAMEAGQGLVRISVRSQLRYAAPLYVWFSKMHDGKADTGSAILFSRTQGTPFAGSNMIDSLPRYYPLPAGRYRLVAHTMGCKELPPPGTVCEVFGKPVPTARYDDQSVEFDVVPGQLTDAGEFVLELPPAIDVGGEVSYGKAYKQMPFARMRWRKISASQESQFASLPLTAEPAVPVSLISSITCSTKAKGAAFYPFRC